MLQPAMYTAFLILTLFIASSASADSFLLADEILKMQAECDYYTKQTDNVILEGSETFPMNPGEDYFKCVDTLDNLKRQYIRENLLGLSFYPEIFPMRLLNGSLVIMSAPAEDESSDLSTRYSDSNHLEEMCSIHESCSRILDHLNESIAKKKTSAVNYFKIKRSHCLEILGKLKVKYINDNHLNVDFLKAYGTLSVTCKNGRTTMSLPESLRSGDNSENMDVASSVQPKSSTSIPTNPKEDKEHESSSESISDNGAYYNEVGLRIKPIISHKEEDPVKSISPKESLKTSQISSVNPEQTVGHIGEIDLSNARIGPKVSKVEKTDEGEVRVRESVDGILPVPEDDIPLQAIENIHSTGKSVTDENYPDLPVKQEELENNNSSSYIKTNQDINNVKKDTINVSGGIENEASSDEDKGKINDKSDKSGKIRISSVTFEENTDKFGENDKTISKSDKNILKTTDKDKLSSDDVKKANDKVVESDNNNGVEKHNDDKSNDKEIDSNDNFKSDNGKIILSLKTKSSTTDTSANQDTDEDMDAGVVVKSDSMKDKGDESLDADNIGNSPVKTDTSKDSAENHGGEVVSNEEPDLVASVVGRNSEDPPDMTNPTTVPCDHDSPLPAESLLMDHPPIITATPSPDTLGDELLDREEDCKQLLNLASKLLQYRTASYLDKEYAACVGKLNHMKIQYIRSHRVDIDKYRTLFPVTLSDGEVRLIHLPSLHSESSTLPNTESTVFPPLQPKTKQEDGLFSDGDGLDDARVRHRSTKYVNRVQMDNPAFISNKKFLEYFNNQVQSGEASTLSKFANMIYRNVGHSEKKIEE